jgi:hypothetical protein
MTEKIIFPTRKHPKNTLLYPIVGHTKTNKLLFTELKTKHNTFILWDHIIQFFTR